MTMYNRYFCLCDRLIHRLNFVGEVALIEGVCEKTIRNRITEGAIPATKNEGERSYKISALQYYETRTEVKSKNSSRNVS